MLNGQHIHDTLLGSRTKMGLLGLGRILRHTNDSKIFYRGKERKLADIKRTYTQTGLEFISYLSHLSSQPSVSYRKGVVSIDELINYNQIISWDSRVNEDPHSEQRLISAVLTASTIQTLSDMSTGIEQQALAEYVLGDYLDSKTSCPLFPTQQKLHVMGAVVLLGNPNSPYSTESSKEFLKNLHRQGMIEYTNMFSSQE